MSNQVRWQGEMMNNKQFHGQIEAARKQPESPQIINATPFHGKIAEASQQPESPITSSPMLHPSSPLYRYSMSPAVSYAAEPIFAVSITHDEQMHKVHCFSTLMSPVISD
jgi:hypothetical protein